MVTTLFVMSSVGSLTCGLESSLERLIMFTYLIATSTESHNGDDATKIYSQTHSAYGHPSMSVTKFHTHAKQQAKL
jgi:hypothetical protein